MGASVLQKLPPFQNVVANGTAVLPDIPQGMVYESLLLQLGGGNTIANMTGIRLWLGGKKIWEVTGQHLDALNKYCKRAGSATFLPLWFANPNAPDIESYMAGAIDTSPRYSNFSLEIDHGAAVGPTLTAFAMKSSPRDKSAQLQGMVRALVKSAHAPASANEFSLPVPIGTRSGALIRAIHFFHAQITKLQVTKDSFFLLQEGSNAVVQYLENEFYRTTQAGLISWDPTQQNDDRDAIPTLREQGVLSTFEFKVTTAAADNITAYSDLLATVDGL